MVHVPPIVGLLTPITCHCPAKTPPNPPSPNPIKLTLPKCHQTYSPPTPQALAERILRAGKSINFMRDSCGDARWVAERAAANQEAAAAVAYGQVGGRGGWE